MRSLKPKTATRADSKEADPFGAKDKPLTWAEKTSRERADHKKKSRPPPSDAELSELDEVTPTGEPGKEEAEDEGPFAGGGAERIRGTGSDGDGDSDFIPGGGPHDADRAAGDDGTVDAEDDDGDGVCR